MIDKTKLAIERVIKFLDNYIALSNGHMVDFFTKNLYKTCIPKSIQDEIEILGYEETVRIILGEISHPKTPNLNNYIDTAKSFSLYNLSEFCLSFSEFSEKLKILAGEEIGSLKLGVFMNSKKAHEVELLSAVSAAVKKITGTSHLIDIGDGRGYLSSLLALHHKIPVLGVDASLINTESAVKRVNRLEKHWHSILNLPKNCESITNANFMYKQVTQFVTEDTNFDELIENVFMQQHTGLGLVGLHTCGNLGPASIRIFNTHKQIKSICNVSCCYHLLNEKYVACSTRFIDCDKTEGLPMSTFLKSRGLNLSRSARMLSAQSIDRILSRRELPSKIIFYRAILEVILKEYCEHAKKNVGKYRKEPENFVEYSRDAFARIGVSVDICDEELERYYDDFTEERIRLNIFHLIRSMLAPVIEALILLDRYLFLLEEGHSDVFLVQIFDPVVSPRCYGLVAFKSD